MYTLYLVGNFSILQIIRNATHENVCTYMISVTCNPQINVLPSHKHWAPQRFSASTWPVSDNNVFADSRFDVRDKKEFTSTLYSL